MTKKYLEIALTEAVRELQVENGSAELYAAARIGSSDRDNFSANEIDFINQCDSFYLASINANGWPYIQHRGGPAGFLKVSGPTTLVMPEFPGNKQYLTMGNLAESDQVSLFLMDYARQARLKIFARSSLVRLADDNETAQAIKGLAGNIESKHALKFELDSFDWNCPKYITPRYTEADVRDITKSMLNRIAELETQVATLQGE